MRRRTIWTRNSPPRSAGSLLAFGKLNDLAAFRRAGLLNALGGKDGREGAALAGGGLDVQPRTVAGQHMLDDGKAKPGAAGLA